MRDIFDKILELVRRAPCAVRRKTSRITAHESLRTRGGFTLTELVLVIGIIGVLSAIFVNTYRSQRVQVEFNDSLTRVLSIMKTARNYAVTSRMVYDGGNLYLPENGYGVYFNKTTKKVILFADTDGTTGAYDTGDIIEEEYTLPDNTVFEAILDEDKAVITPNPNEVTVIFKPPLADTEINKNNPANQLNTVYFRFSRAGAPDDADKYIYINKTAGFPELEL